MSYDVIIVNYNGEKIISDCLKSVYESSTLPAKVIIYDNDSKDRSVEIIKKNFPKVVLIEGKKNLGFGRANNEAMKVSESEFILFMNNDLLLDKKCSEVLLKSFTEKDIAIMNPLIYKGWDKASSEVYSFGSEMNRSGFAYGLFDVGVDRTDLSCFSGACFMAQSSLIKENNFEEKFFLYYEEPDISAKMLIKKLRIGRVKKAVCYHLENYSSPQDSAKGIVFRQFYAIQNRWYMLGKFWPMPLLLGALPLNLLHLFYNVFFFLTHGKFKEAKLLYLSAYKLFQGRRWYRPNSNNGWTKQLKDTSLGNLLKLQKKVYSNP